MKFHCANGIHANQRFIKLCCIVVHINLCSLNPQTDSVCMLILPQGLAVIASRQKKKKKKKSL